MKQIALCAILLLASKSPVLAEQVYLNTFDNLSSLDGFARVTRPGIYTTLYDLVIDSGQLRIDPKSYYPPSPPPTVRRGGVTLFGDFRELAPEYNTKLASNPGPVTWAFNLRNQDGDSNNSFALQLAKSWNVSSSHIGTNFARGYVFNGGGFVGNRMGLWLAGRESTGSLLQLIDIADGLAPGQYGSFRIVYDPLTHKWSVFGFLGDHFVDPTTVSNLLGSATSSEHTSLSLPYFGIGGFGSGSDWFDNLSVCVAGAEAELLVDLKVNGSDENIVVSTRRVSPSIAFNPGPHAGKPVKWWVFVRSPRSWQHFDYKAWAWRPGAGITLNDAEAATLPETTLPDYRPSSGGLHTFIFMALLGEGKDRIRVVDSVNVRFRRGR